MTGIKYFYVIRDKINFFPGIESSGKLKLVLRGVKRLQKHVKRTRLPITYSILQSLVHRFAPDYSKFTINLKHSKSDTSHAGVIIPMFANGTNICPVMLMRRFYSLRLKSGATPNDPLFLLANGDILSRQYFIVEMRQVLRLLNYNDVNFNGAIV